jgi:hypothetical protein
MFLRPPFHFILNTALDAVKRLVNLPLASNLTPAVILCLSELKTIFSMLEVLSCSNISLSCNFKGDLLDKRSKIN